MANDDVGLDDVMKLLTMMNLGGEVQNLKSAKEDIENLSEMLGNAKHIRSVDPNVREAADTAFQEFILNRFKMIRNIPLSKNWAVKKRWMAMKASGSSEEIKLGNTYKRSRNVGGAAIKRSGRKSKGKSYLLHVGIGETNADYKRVLPANVPVFGRASDHLIDSILETLRMHSNNSQFTAIVSAAKDGTVEYHYELHERLFWKQYPKFLDSIIKRHGMPGLISMSTDERKRFDEAATEAFHRIVGAAGTISGNRPNKL